ncbi:hypothetical protein BOX15_Mlig002332g1 [Macrostomum lignano]|uniref:Uncharacterized protein n=1 Tax=Macrostomum lignano TaxID=282301 RepID=A0A267E633_9PLAT|nr:hypothetical protein BOX15_Mlig002332g1 [Macrostomum lignano]
MEPWDVRKSAILAKYTTTAKLTLVSSYLAPSSLSAASSGATGASSTASAAAAAAQSSSTSLSDKVKSRLEQLDELAEDTSSKEVLSLSQADFAAKVDELTRALRRAWDEDQRVRALKLVIQCVKLLGDSTPASYYPSKFVLLTDLLDTFGNLVFDRLAEKASGGGKLRPDFRSNSVPEGAKETAKNWFYKIASIRELLPRLYVEAALLPCYRFVDDRLIGPAIGRLGGMCRGIGNQTVAAYARCYLARLGAATGRLELSHLTSTIDDCNLLLTSPADQLAPCLPALDWLVLSLARHPDARGGDPLRRLLLDAEPCLLAASLAALPPELIAEESVAIGNAVASDKVPQSCCPILVQLLGDSLTQASAVGRFPGDGDRESALALLNSAWGAVRSANPRPDEYIACASAWVSWVAKCLQLRELTTLLRDLAGQLSPDRAFESVYPQLIAFLTKLVTTVGSAGGEDFGRLITSPAFLQLFDLFQKESVRVEAACCVLDAYMAWTAGRRQDDSELASTGLFLCRLLHDSLTVVSLEDDRRRYASLICAFVSSLDFGSDFQRQLDFLVDCRAAFGHLEPVLAHLIRLVNGLAARTLAVVHGRHTARTSAFTHACAAFSFVTLPSLDEPGLRCQLYLESAQVALLNQCYGQADALLKEAIRLLLQLLAKPHQQLQQPLPPQLHPLLSSLVLFPDDPDSKQPLTLLTGLVNGLCASPPPVGDEPTVAMPTSNGLAESAQQQSIASRRPECIVPVLVTIATMSQDKYPYRVEGVSANDVLLAGSQKARSHLADLSGQLMRHLLIELDNLATAPTGQQAQQQHQRRRLRDLRLGLLCGLADHCDLTAPDTAALFGQLWQLTAASIDGGGDVQQARAALAQLRDRAAEWPEVAAAIRATE